MFKDERLIKIPWNKITLEEAIWKMEAHGGNCYCDGDKKVVILEE